MTKITAKQFKAAVGHAPQDDDLERCNCPKAGQIFHNDCGWNFEKNPPNFIANYPEPTP